MVVTRLALLGYYSAWLTQWKSIDLNDAESAAKPANAAADYLRKNRK